MVLHFQNITQFYRINVDIHYEMRSAGISCFMNHASNHAGWFEPYNVIVAIFEQTQGRCKMKLGEKKKGSKGKMHITVWQCSEGIMHYIADL